MISRLERGDHVPSLKTLCRIADAFGPGSFHGPELQRIATEEGTLEISIFETGVSPRFRLSGVTADTVTVQTHQGGDERQDFSFANRGTYWESVEQSALSRPRQSGHVLQCKSKRLRHCYGFDQWISCQRHSI